MNNSVVTLDDNYDDDDVDMLCVAGMTFAENEVYRRISWCLEGVVHIILSLMGFLANAIAARVMLSSELLNNIFNRTLAILAVVDAVFNVCDILESVRIYHYDRIGCLPKGPLQTLHLYLFPKVLHPLRQITMLASIYITVVLALERYFAVSKPISTFVNCQGRVGKKVLIYTVPVLLFSIIFNLPKFFEFYIKTCTVGCTEDLLRELPQAEFNASSETIDSFKARIANSTISHGEEQASRITCR